MAVRGLPYQMARADEVNSRFQLILPQINPTSGL